jgi:hypothetical protein
MMLNETRIARSYSVQLRGFSMNKQKGATEAAPFQIKVYQCISLTAMISPDRRLTFT